MENLYKNLTNLSIGVCWILVLYSIMLFIIVCKLLWPTIRIELKRSTGEICPLIFFFLILDWVRVLVSSKILPALFCGTEVTAAYQLQNYWRGFSDVLKYFIRRAIRSFVLMWGAGFPEGIFPKRSPLDKHTSRMSSPISALPTPGNPRGDGADLTQNAWMNFMSYSPCLLDSGRLEDKMFLFMRATTSSKV